MFYETFVQRYKKCFLFFQNVLYFLKMFFIFFKFSLFSLNFLYLWVGILFFSIWFHMWHPGSPIVTTFIFQPECAEKVKLYLSQQVVPSINRFFAKGFLKRLTTFAAWNRYKLSNENFCAVPSMDSFLIKDFLLTLWESLLWKSCP